MKRLLPLALLLLSCGDPADGDIEPAPSPESPALPDEPTATAAPTPTPRPEPTAAPTPRPTPKPPLVGPATCTVMKTGKPQGGQFTNNPENSKGTLKLIWPNEFTDRIVDVTIWGAPNFFEKLQRKTPNEYNNRERYYGEHPIGSYPKPMVVGALLYDGNRVCVTLPDPEKRVDWRLE